LKVTIQIKRNPRTGKPITVISELKHNPQVIKNLESKLKSACGSGGYIDGKTITLNGSHLNKVQEILEKEGFTVKT
jgi:translation initiation factor 1